MKKLSSRKFLTTVGTVVGIAIMNEFGVKPEIIKYAVLLAGVYVGTEGILDFTSLLKKVVKDSEMASPPEN